MIKIITLNAFKESCIFWFDFNFMYIFYNYFFYDHNLLIKFIFKQEILFPFTFKKVLRKSFYLTMHKLKN